MPVYWRVFSIALILAVIAAAMHREIRDYYLGLLPATAQVRLIDGETGQGIRFAGRADVFALDRTVYQPSPMPVIGSVDLAGAGEELWLSSEQFPGSIQVRFHVPSYGVDYASVELGKRRAFKLILGRPSSVSGVVRDKRGKPVPGARIVGLGGSSRGVVLAETKTDAAGRYTLSQFSSRVPYLVIRILGEGFALKEREYWPNAVASHELSKTDFVLTPVPPVLGEVRMSVGLGEGEPPPSLRVSVLNLPGANTDVREGGSFVLHHLKAGMRCRLLLQGLPDGLTHRLTRASAGIRVTIEIVPAVSLRGRVISGETGRGLHNVSVRHEHTSRGGAWVRTGRDGWFELPEVPVGPLLLTVSVPDGPTLDKSVDVLPADRSQVCEIRIE